MPSPRTHVHTAASRASNSLHVAAVLGQAFWLPHANSILKEARNVRTYEGKGERVQVPSRTQCHHANTTWACSSRAAPTTCPGPLRSIIAWKSLSRCDQQL